MSIYLLLYFVIVISILFIWFYTFKKYKKYTYWKYFFISTICYSIWLIIYLLSFTLTYDKEILLIFSRLLYLLSLIGMYSMLFFILFYNTKQKYIKYHISILLTFILIIFLSLFTTYIIKDMIYSTELKIYYEKFWVWYILYSILYLIYPFLLLIFSYLKIKTLNTIKKSRFKYLSLWFFIFVINEVIFLALLPLFNIWILQKEQVLFFIPFIIWILYSTNRYHFLNIRIWSLKIIAYLISIWLTIISTFIIYKILFFYYKLYNQDLALLFWKQDKYLSEYDLIFYIFLSILLFIIFHKLINTLFKYDNFFIVLTKKLNRLKKEIPFITNTYDLNNYLKIEFIKIFNIKYLEIKINNYENTEINNYFSKNKLNTLFINDIVFIEEKKNKFNYNIIQKEINNKSYLIFPIKNNKKELIWIFSIWKKRFWDEFYSEEINILKEFILFLEWHIKYIWIYNEINNLNLNLDKLVDKKTIEYNTLINKQREFIWYISHEIKTPIANSIFQADCIIHNIKEWNYKDTTLVKDMNIINSGLLKSWDLLNKLFDIEKYDINKYKLYKEKTNLNKLLKKEINIFKKVNKNIDFIIDIPKLNLDINLDIIQFIQVIDNLINNAIKFCNWNKPIIKISGYTLWSYIYIIIEDNWKWFNKIDTISLFDKYSTGKTSSAWLGMWLYLCKKIVEMHNWTISANSSSKLWWAEFTIKLAK